MKKHFFLSLLAAVSCLAMVSCGDDDKSSDSNSTKALLNQISENQMIYNGQVIDLSNVEINVRPPQEEDVGAHYVDFIVSGNSCRFDFGKPLNGVAVDLANPRIGEYQFAIMLDTKDTHFSMDVFDPEMYSQINDVDYENTSCFSDGSSIFTHTDKEFTLTMYGTLKNNDTFAFKLVVPENEVNYWN